MEKILALDRESYVQAILEEVRSARRGRVAFAEESDPGLDALARRVLAHSRSAGISVSALLRKVESLAKEMDEAAGTEMSSEDIALVERAGFKVEDVNEMVQRQRRARRIARGGKGAPLTLEERELIRRAGGDPDLIERANEIDSPESYRRVAAELGRGQ